MAAAADTQGKSKSKVITNQLLPSSMNTVVPRRGFLLESIDQKRNLLNSKIECEDLSKVGRGQSRRLSYTILVGQLRL